MAFIIKSLAANTAGAGTTVLYSVTTSASMVTSVRLVNGNANNTASVNLYVRKSGSANAQRIAKQNYSIAVGAMLLVDDTLTLGPGDQVEVNVSGTSPSVGYLVNGFEQE